MADDLKKMYRTVMDDNFPPEITISFGDQTLVYRKRSWKIPDAQTGETIEKGLRYGENPGQEAALYELINGNLALADCKFIEGGKGLVSSVTEEDMIQSGKHPGKTNLTDIDNSLNVLKYLTEKPAAVIVKHNNPCGVAYGENIADAYDKANRADRIVMPGTSIRSIRSHSGQYMRGASMPRSSRMAFRISIILLQNSLSNSQVASGVHHATSSSSISGNQTLCASPAAMRAIPRC